MDKNINILIINSGSSSIKYQMITMPSEAVVCEGKVERIGEESSSMTYETANVSLNAAERIQNHKIGLLKIAEALLDSQNGVIKESSDIKVIGHRVVHGGNSFSKTTLITDEVKHKIKKYAILAPLHNPT